MPSGAVIAQEEAFKDFGDGFSPSGLATALRKAGRCADGSDAETLAAALDALGGGAPRVEFREGEQYLRYRDGPKARSVEAASGVAVDLLDDGSICGVSLYLE